LSSTETSPTRWIQVAKTGEFVSSRYGKFSITKDDLKSMLHNFTSVTPISPTQLPVDYDHLSMNPKTPGDGKAAGWFVNGKMELRANDQELWAEVEFTPDALESVQKKEYRFVSPSFVKDYVWKNGKNIGTTLIAAAITNHPFLEGMAAITLANDEFALAMPMNAGGASMEIGQRVLVKPEAAPAKWDAKTPCEIKEIAGGGDDQFGKLQTLDGDPVGWFRVTELLPARTDDKSNTRSSDMAMDVIKLRNAHGTEVEVKAEDVAQFMADQLVAAEAKGKGTVPEGSVMISASKLAEFEATNQNVVSLSDRLKKAEDAAKDSEKRTHVIELTSKLDKMAGRVTKPQRDYALAEFAEPGQMEKFDLWAKANVSTKAIVNLAEIGSGADAHGDTSEDASHEIAVAAAARAKEKGISLAQAANEVATERRDLAADYRREIRGTDSTERIIH
jgi:hypothetical protein